MWFFIGETMKTHIGGSPYSHTNPYFLIDDRWQTFLPFYSGFSLKMAPIRIGSQHVPATWVLCHHMVWKPWQQPGQVPWRHSLDGTLWGSTFLKELSWVIDVFFSWSFTWNSTTMLFGDWISLISMGIPGSQHGGTVPYKAIFCGDIHLHRPKQ